LRLAEGGFALGFATVSFAVDLGRRPAPQVAVDEVVSTFPGTRNVSFDGTAVHFDIVFPGNLTALAGRLRSANVPIVGDAQVRIPIERIAPERAARTNTAERMIEGPEIWDVEFPRGHYVKSAHMEGDVACATIEPSNYGMHQLYDSLLNAGMMAQSEPVEAWRAH
jgi:hypothetical protein